MYRRYETVHKDSEHDTPPLPVYNIAKKNVIKATEKKSTSNTNINTHENKNNNNKKKEITNHAPSKKANKNKKTKFKIADNPITSLIPVSLYNPKNKKILGFLTAEDLLLIALIFLFLDNEDSDSSLIVYALIFVLISDWLDLSFLENIF